MNESAVDKQDDASDDAFESKTMIMFSKASRIWDEDYVSVEDFEHITEIRKLRAHVPAPGSGDNWLTDRTKETNKQDMSTLKSHPSIFPGYSLLQNDRRAGVTLKDTSTLAHILPKDSSCSIFWEPMVRILINSPAAVEDNIVGWVEGVRGEAFSGLKNLATNLLKFPGSHFEIFDHMSMGKLVITPVWTNDLNTWTPGTPYSLLVLANERPVTQRLVETKEDLENFKWLGQATPDDIRLATDKLRLMMGALGEQLLQDDMEQLLSDCENRFDEYYSKSASSTSTTVNGSQSDGNTPSSASGSHSNRTTQNTSNPSKKKNQKKDDLVQKKKKLKALIAEIAKEKKVKVPRVKDDIDSEEFHILKVDLAEYYAGHFELIPDPFLVLLRGAVNCSAIYNDLKNKLDGKLLPACPSLVESPDEVSSEDGVSISDISEIGIPCKEDDEVSIISDCTEGGCDAGIRVVTP